MTGSVIYLRKDKSVIFNGLDKEQLKFLAHIVAIYTPQQSLDALGLGHRQINSDILGIVPLFEIQRALMTVYLRHKSLGDVLSDDGLSILESLPEGFKVLIKQKEYQP